MDIFLPDYLNGMNLRQMTSVPLSENTKTIWVWWIHWQWYGTEMIPLPCADFIVNS